MNTLLGNCTAEGTDIVTFSCVPLIFGNIVYWALIFAGIVALAFIIFSGIKFLTSQGDPKAVEGARKTLTWAIAGLVLILLSFAIVNFIAQTTNVTCINKFGFTNCTSSTRACTGSPPSCRSGDPRCNTTTGAWYCGGPGGT